ncbi:NmrA family transcriptional regulator [Arsenicibacter rosenii]|uniref:NmrA family transcriptional regulator n=2 Tax=Arsenicibacter rosenii TaxID=1750698 RepID=A0A1S2VTM4_9BACT|nr:NmrA family transcriptional regulator [Arsenicibacter rosenii]
MLGRPVTEGLLAAGFPVRIVARKPENAKRLFQKAEVVAGDLRQPDSLVAAFQGADIVYLNLSVKQTEKPGDFHTESDGLTHVLTAAKAAGVKRIAYLSSIVMRYQGMHEFDWWVFRIKQEAVRRIKTAGLHYSIFYPSCFMETLLHTQRLGPFILLIGRSPVQPYYIAAQDYARQVAAALQLAGDQPQEYVIQGPEGITQHEAAERFVRAYAASRLMTLTVPPVLLKAGSRFTQQADYGRHIGEALNNYPEVFEAARTWADLGKPQTTIEDFAKSVNV